jgi:NAD(P)-dependent dehydrogenase (short-subunit alcohol dehydrogenase family)
LHPLRRMAEPEEVIDAVLYLENAPLVTGTILHVDGGARGVTAEEIGNVA